MDAVGARSILAVGVEAMGVAGTEEILLALDEVIQILDGTFDCLLKV